MTSACRGPLTESPMTSPLARNWLNSASTRLSSSTRLSMVAEWIWYRSRKSPRSERLSVICRRSAASDWSFTSWTLASTCQLPT